MKTKFICQFSDEIQNNIYKDVRNTLYEIGLRESELKESVETAMDSRLCDLEDTIDITKYLVATHNND